VGSLPELSARNTTLLIVGPGTREDAQKLAVLLKVDGSFILYDGTGDVYEAYTLDRVMMSMIQQSGVFIIDKAGTLRFVQTANVALKWVSPQALSGVLNALKEIEPDQGQF
jgi:hypothetical protein